MPLKASRPWYRVDGTADTSWPHDTQNLSLGDTFPLHRPHKLASNIRDLDTKNKFLILKLNYLGAARVLGLYLFGPLSPCLDSQPITEIAPIEPIMESPNLIPALGNRKP